MPKVNLISGRTFISREGETLLDAALREGIGLPYSCRTGRCSTCKARVLQGETTATSDETGLQAGESEQGWVLTCVRQATGDLLLEAKEFDASRYPEAKTLPCKIHSLDKLAPDVMRVLLRFPLATPLRFLAGQYVDVIGQGGLRRSYSIANAERADRMIELHIRHVEEGAMSRYWFEDARVNDLLRVNGPIGTFSLQEVEDRDLVFLATGTGIAPVKAMLESLRDGAADVGTPRSVQIYWGGRVETDLYWSPTVLDATQQYHPVLSRAGETWGGARGHVQDVFLSTQPNLTQALVYACGSESMIRSARSALRSAGLPDGQFFSDAFVCSADNNKGANST